MLILRFLHLNMMKGESTFLSRVKGRGYFFECRGYIVEGPYFTLKNVWKSVKRIYIKLRIAYSPLLSLLISVYSVVTQRSSAARIRKKYDNSCVARLTFLRECTHFLSVRVPIACGQISLNLQKKMLSSILSSTSPLANIFQFVTRVFLILVFDLF